MIRLLSQLVKWLEVRFPEKVVVLESDYRALHAKVEALESNLADLEDFNTKLVKDYGEVVNRLIAIETAAVHKGAVQDLVKVVAEIKADLASFKTSIGFRTQASNDEIQAILNGSPISNE